MATKISGVSALGLLMEIYSDIWQNTSVSNKTASSSTEVGYDESEINTILQTYPDAYIVITPNGATTTLNGTVKIEFTNR